MNLRGWRGANDRHAFCPHLLARIWPCWANDTSHNYPPGMSLDFYQETIELENLSFRGVVQINHHYTFYIVNALEVMWKESFAFFTLIKGNHIAQFPWAKHFSIFEHIVWDWIPLFSPTAFMRLFPNAAYGKKDSKILTACTNAKGSNKTNTEECLHNISPQSWWR